MASRYEFDMDVFTPMTLPMARLAEYMKDLAVLFGADEHVHFLEVAEGSACPKIAVDDQAIAKVDRRLLGARDRKGPATAVRAYDSIDRRLEQDGCIATLRSDSGITLNFAGRKRAKQKTLAEISEHGYVEGELVLIGGRDESISAYLRDGDNEYICRADRGKGRDMAHHVFNQLRVFGTGHWRREETGSWKLDYMDVENFVPLQEEPFTKTIQRLRALPKPAVDPTAVLASLKNGDSE